MDTACLLLQYPVTDSINSGLTILHWRHCQACNAAVPPPRKGGQPKKTAKSLTALLSGFNVNLAGAGSTTIALALKAASIHATFAH